jgi:uncharacterized membrane protein YsdA (DUF1294 family)/cold shock CspA family protein
MALIPSMEKMRASGRIVKWRDDKGYGFIEPKAGGKEVFVHIKSFPGNMHRPAMGTEVHYVVARDSQGRARAEDVRLVGENLPLGRATKAFIAAALFFLIVAIVTALEIIPIYILWIYMGMSALTFTLYALDKSAARKSARRTPENTLHWLALLGGWPGALFAQQLFRHKSCKTSFRVVFWITLMLNVAALGFLVSPRGAGAIEFMNSSVQIGQHQ